MLTGTIVENSLANIDILTELSVKNTYSSGSWVLHDVEVNENQIPTLAAVLKDGPWYIHLWNLSQDILIIIFKDKVFEAKCKDKTTWQQAIEYGKSIGIPEEQLDFPIK